MIPKPTPTSDPLTLYREDIVVRKMLLSDYPQIIELCVYDGVFARNEAEAVEIGRQIQKDCDEGNSVHWALCERESGRIVGTIGFYRGFENAVGEIGYIVKPEVRGRGYCTKAIVCVTSFGFSHLNLDRVVAYTGTTNIASRRALEANGFRLETQDDAGTKYFLNRMGSDPEAVNTVRKT